MKLTLGRYQLAIHYKITSAEVKQSTHHQAVPQDLGDFFIGFSTYRAMLNPFTVAG